jgi:hypothetical protein
MIYLHREGSKEMEARALIAQLESIPTEQDHLTALLAYPGHTCPQHLVQYACPAAREPIHQIKKHQPAVCVPLENIPTRQERQPASLAARVTFSQLRMALHAVPVS